MQDLLSILLSNIYNLDIVLNSLEAKNLNQHTDIIITDIRIPDDSRIELIKSLKLDYLNLIKIAYINYSYPQYGKNALKLTLNTFFIKIVIQKEFMTQLKNYVLINGTENLLESTNFRIIKKSMKCLTSKN